MSSPFRLKERITEVKLSDYRLYRLKFNPFPMSGVAPEHPRISAARREAYERISNFIVSTYKSKSWAGMAIIAEYGNGKTHTLKLIRDSINEELATTSQGKCIAVYIENLGDSLNNMIFEIFREIGFSFFIELLWNIFTSKIKPKLSDPNFIAQLKSRQQRLITHSEDFADFFSSINLFKEALRRRYMEKSEVINEIKNCLRGVISNRDFITCCVILFTEEEDEKLDIAWKFMSGGTLTQAEYKRIGLSKKSFTQEEIQREVFNDILSVFRQNSFTNIYLLIDEIEELIPIPKLKKRQLLQGLRSIIDNNKKNLMMVIAMTEAGWVDLKENSPPLADRFPIIVELPPLTPEQTRELIVSYLSLARIEGEEETIFPFDEKLIREIWSKTGGNLRRILEVCHTLIEKGIARKLSKLDVSLLTNITD